MTKLLLSADIYSYTNIIETCDAYRGFADIKFTKKDSYYELTFDDCKYDSDITIKEFENYLINIENLK